MSAKLIPADYQVARAPDLDRLCVAVDALVAQGYKPVGGISAYRYREFGNDCEDMVQAMFRERQIWGST